MHKGFDHDDFAKTCDECFMPQLISYNSNQLVKDRFKKWRAGEFDLTYTMRSVGEYMREQKERKELLLMNYETEKTVENLGEGVGEKQGSNDREADTIARIRTLIFMSYLVTNLFIISGVIRHWN